eukprot:TRINITY_DN16608_c0_g1_i1.p1 TRINITY_DN16608_c0_g1~~TRINITY_DN16608_c0_g1_i1.p1  ORF type:complete len:198 (-),score=38.41 TRINITY_DN16608_c0_g1_i1:154-672(-)
MEGPRGICVTENGHIIVANSESNVLSIHTGDTNDISKFGALIKLVGDNDGVVFINPTSVAVNSRGELLVSSQHKIDIFNSDYQFVKSFGSWGVQNGEMYFPGSLCVDAFDNILLCDFLRRIQVFDREGNWIHTFGKEGKENGCFQRSVGVSIDSENGDIFVVDDWAHSLMGL